MCVVQERKGVSSLCACSVFRSIKWLCLERDDSKGLWGSRWRTLGREVLHGVCFHLIVLDRWGAGGGRSVCGHTCLGSCTFFTNLWIIEILFGAISGAGVG